MIIGFQYVIVREAIEAGAVEMVDQAKEFALVKMAEEAAAHGCEAQLDQLGEKRYHAKVVISVDDETGEEMGDLVFLPDADPEWTMLVIRWTCPVIVTLHDLKIHDLSIDPQPNAFGHGLEVVDKELDDRVCRVCGCTTTRACVTGDIPCHWVADDLCSACEAKALRP